MSTKKITALTELSAAPAATDMIPIVDVSDTTDAATGTTKKITSLNVGKGIGIGAGSTTAEPVKIDTSNGRLGIGTAAPSKELQVMGGVTSVSSDWNVGSAGSMAELDVIGSGNVYSRLQAYTAGGSGYGDISLNPLGGNVGIGTTAPTHVLHVAANGFPTFERFAGASTAGSGTIYQKSRGSSAGSFTIVTDGDYLGSLVFKGADGNSWADAARIDAGVDGTPGDGDMPGRLVFSTTADGAEAVSERMRIDSKGNMLLGGTATPTSSVGNLCLFNGTAPAASVTNGVVLYAQDVSTSELKVRDEAGNIATLSPHNFDLLGERSEDMAWSYSCKNAFVGKEIAVDMTKVIRALEKLTGEEYIKIRDIADSEKLDWATEEKRKETERKAEVAVYKAKKAEADAYPTSSSTKADIKAYLDENEIEYEDGAKDELFKKVPEKETFTEVEPAAYTKKSKPSWIS